MGSKKKAKPILPSQGWWEGDSRERGQNVKALCDTLATQAEERLANHRRWFELYCGRMQVRDMGMLGGAVYSEKMPANEVRSVVDTQVARLTRYWARPMHIVDDGDYVTVRRAMRCDQFVEGVMQNGGFEVKGRQTFLKAAITGCAGIKIIPMRGNKLPQLNHVAAHEVLVDEMEALYGEPRTMLHWHLIDRRVAMACYPEQADELANASRVPFDSAPYRTVQTFAGVMALAQTNADLLLAVEAWHLPSDPDAPEEETDGRHVIEIDGVSVADTPWTRERYPIALMRYQPHPLQWWGMGICDQTESLQAELAQMVLDVRRGLRAHRPHLVVRKGFNVRQISNELLGIWESDDPSADVKMFNPSVFSPEFYSWLQHQRSWIWEACGVSRMVGQGVKPIGLESKPALRAWENIESERHVVTGRAYEQLAMDVAQLIEDEVRSVAAEVGAENVVIRAPVPGTRNYRKLTWKDVELAPEQYTMKVYPVSAFASSPPARMEQLLDLLKMGQETGVPIIRPEDVPQLLAMPELQGYDARQFTDEKIAEFHMSRLLHDGVYVPPSPFVNFEIALGVARRELLIAEKEGAPPERTQLVVEYMGEVNAYLDQQQEQARAAAVAASGAAGSPLGLPAGERPAGPPPPPPEGGQVIPFAPPQGASGNETEGPPPSAPPE